MTKNDYIVVQICPSIVMLKTTCCITLDDPCVPGKKKTAEAWVSVKNKGTGQWAINGKDLSYFPNLAHR